MADIRWTRLSVVMRVFVYLRVLLLAMAGVLVPAGRLTLPVVIPMLAIGVISLTVCRSQRRLLPLVGRHPLTLALDAVAAYLVLEFGEAFGPLFLFTVVTSALAGLLYEWQGLLFVCALQIALYDTAARSVETASFQAVIALPVFYPLAGCAGIALRGLLSRYADAEEAVRAAESAAAAAEERARLAREMHDSLAKTLHGISLNAEALPVWVRTSPERAVREAGNIVAAARAAAGEARGLIADLRDDCAREPFNDLLRRIVAEWAGVSRVAARAVVDADVEPPREVRLQLAAILREALTNVERHARACDVEVSLTTAGGRLAMSVRDDGRGFACPADVGAFARNGHYGLVGMSERARLAGGALTVSAADGGGTRLTVELPLAFVEEEAVR